MIWITGNSGAGKTTLARRMKKENTILLDGNDMRKVWGDLGFSKEDRYEQNLRTSRLADILERQGFEVIISNICPFKELREMIDRNHSVKWIYLPGGKPPTKEMPYET